MNSIQGSDFHNLITGLSEELCRHLNEGPGYWKYAKTEPLIQSVQNRDTLKLPRYEKTLRVYQVRFIQVDLILSGLTYFQLCSCMSILGSLVFIWCVRCLGLVLVWVHPFVRNRVAALHRR